LFAGPEFAGNWNLEDADVTGDGRFDYVSVLKVALFIENWRW